ncbi:MAG: hypothetical protein AseanaTS_21490 [Candidatus Pelagadaptatus aseana]
MYFISALFVSGLALGTWTTSTHASDFAIDNMELRAHLNAQRHTTLAAEFDAKINRIRVAEGEAFKAGQTLIYLDCDLQQAQQQKAKANLAGTQNTLAGNKRLQEHNAIGQVELENSRIEVLKAKADVSYLDTTLKKCQIKAPYNGRAGERHAQEQQFVQAGQSLLDIFDDSVLELEFIMPSRWMRKVKPGYGFDVHIDELDKPYPAKLVRTAARIDPVSQSVKAIAIIDGQFPELMVGMSGRILLTPPAP